MISYQYQVIDNFVHCTMIQAVNICDIIGWHFTVEYFAIFSNLWLIKWLGNYNITTIYKQSIKLDVEIITLLRSINNY